MHIHHRHSGDLTIRSIAQSIADIATPVIIPRDDSSKTSSSPSSSCTPGDKSPTCETPVKNNTGLAIGLGAGIPLFIAFVALLYLHLRNKRKLKKEDEDDKNIDIDNDDFGTIGRLTPAAIRNYKMAKSSQQTLTDDMDDVDLNDISNGNNNKYIINEKKSHSSHSSGSNHSPISPTGYNNPASPFYAIPELESSQKSLHNYNPFDKTAYPPTSVIYSNPSYPPSAYTRSGSPVSIMSNPYGPTNNNLRGVSSKQNLNNQYQQQNQSRPQLEPIDTAGSYHSNDNINNNNNNSTGVPRAPFRRRLSHGSSTLSIVSSHTPTTITPKSLAIPVTASAAQVDRTSASSQLSSTNIGIETDNQQINNNNNTSNQNVKFDQDEQQQQYNKDDDNETTNSSNLNRSDTKVNRDFDRVKSVYKEYFPNNNLDSPEQKSKEFDFERDGDDEDDLIVDNGNNNNNTQMQAGQNYNQQQPPENIQQQQQLSHNNNNNINNQEQYDHYDHYNDDHQQNDLVNPQYASYNQDYQQPLQFQQQQPLASPASSATFRSAPSPGENSFNNTHRNPIQQQQNIPYPPPTPSSITYSGPPSQAPSQASFRSVQQLPNLSKLPVPHNLSETDSSISYARVNRHGGASTPSNNNSNNNNEDPDDLLSPSIPVYNPMHNGLSNQDESQPLPSPHQFRKSVALMTNFEFTPPKKYITNESEVQGSNGSIHSVNSRRPGTPTGGVQARPASELVFDSKTQMDKLRPTMQMR